MASLAATTTSATSNPSLVEPVETDSKENDWRDQAVCSSPEVQKVFFPVGVTGLAAVQIEEAKQVCASCPVRDTCLEYAITTNQEYGIWGGTSEEERRALRREWRKEQRRLRDLKRQEQRRQRAAS